ncbi:hypothetical protein HMPREF3207_02243 [Citrobacter koseri]|nr:hypothetical protein HMPREF3207_02243 [Citrobacter koseri]
MPTFLPSWQPARYTGDLAHIFKNIMKSYILIKTTALISIFNII